MGAVSSVKATSWSRPLEILYYCPTCGRANKIAPPIHDPEPPCRSCGSTLRLEASGAAEPGRAILRCAVCGDTHFYVRKDFNQTVGCTVVGIGAVLVPWTYGLSLAVCALLDYLFYLSLPMITVCYVCASRYRGIPLNPEHSRYELMTAQTYEARSLNWRRFHARTD